MKVQRRNSSNSNLILISISIISIIFGLFCFNGYYAATDDNFGNLEVEISDFSILKENPSCKIIFDDSIFYEINHITDFKTKYFNLKNGKHKVEVSDLNNSYYVIDTILIKNYPEQNELYIRFNHNISYENYLPIYKKRFYNSLVRRYNLKSNEDKMDLMFQIDKKIDLNYLKDKTIYKPSDRNYEITFYDEKILLN